MMMRMKRVMNEMGENVYFEIELMFYGDSQLDNDVTYLIHLFRTICSVHLVRNLREFLFEFETIVSPFLLKLKLTLKSMP